MSIRLNIKYFVRNLPSHLVIWGLVFIALVPVAILAFNSFKAPVEVAKNPLGIPQDLVWDNYPKAWERGHYSTTTKNSAILVVITVSGVLFFGGLAAYSLAKLNVPGSNFLMMYLLAVSTLPIQLFLIPLFYLWRQLNLTNTLPGVALIYIALNAPFAIFLIRSYIVQLPSEFEDAARVDGANEWQIFSHVIVPLAWPAFLTSGLVVALGVWNELIIATIFLTDPDLFTVVTSYYKFTERFGLRDWGLTSAAAIMMIAPVLVIFLLLQRRFIEGLTQGGLKV